VRGTAFQRRVWQALQGVPIGQTVSYTEIARRIGSPNAMRAVAGACAANHLAVAIPCHRVVRTTGRSPATRGVLSASRPCLRARRPAVFSAADTVWRGRHLPSAQRKWHLQYEGENRSELKR